MTPKQTDKWKREVGKRLRDCILELCGYRQEYKFAKLVDISQGSLSDILNGKNSPSALTLRKIHRNTRIDIVKLIA